MFLYFPEIYYQKFKYAFNRENNLDDSHFKEILTKNKINQEAEIVNCFNDEFNFNKSGRLIIQEERKIKICRNLFSGINDFEIELNRKVNNIKEVEFLSEIRNEKSSNSLLKKLREEREFRCKIESIFIENYKNKKINKAILTTYNISKGVEEAKKQLSGNQSSDKSKTNSINYKEIESFCEYK